MVAVTLEHSNNNAVHNGIIEDITKIKASINPDAPVKTKRLQ
jgi:hypothetical protein